MKITGELNIVSMGMAMPIIILMNDATVKK